MLIDVWLIAFVVYWFTKAAQDAIMSDGHGFDPDAKYKSPKVPVDKIKNKLWKLYHKINGLKYQERFPFSATFLVMFTDLWHLFGTFRHVCVVWLAWLVVGSTVLDFLILYVIGLLVFNISFRVLRLVD